MSHIECPECGHRIRIAVTDEELRFEEDVDWEMATIALAGEPGDNAHPAKRVTLES